MTKFTDQEKRQILNIINTLTEAAEHMQVLVKEREFSKAIYSFSSFVEGFQVVSKLSFQFTNPQIGNVIKQIENNISFIAGEFERANLLKIDEVMQFSFVPSIKKLKSYAETENGKEQPKAIVVGIYHSIGNPKDFYPEPRTTALIKESARQNVKLLFFTSSDVDFDTEQVYALTFKDGEWKRISAKFPDVINNVGAGKRSHTERKLRRLIPFTSFHVGNKFSLPKRMLENHKYAELLVPFTVAMEKKQIYKFMEDNNKTVFKALKSNRGEDIYFVTKKGQRFAIAEHKDEKIYSKQDFDRWLDDIILEDKGSYIIQRFVLTRTKNNEPYHFRAHVQKNGTGKWVLTHIYPRVGNQKSNLSNVVNDGRVDDFHEFMIREFNENADKYESDILQLSIEIALHLDKLYGFGIDELGIDLAIDETGRYWMHEANNGPQTAFHEEKRAVNTIAYAKYIAENGIFYDETVRKAQSGLFQAHLSTLPKYDSGNKPLLAVMGWKFEENNDLISALTAHREQVTIAYFIPKNIDYHKMLIKSNVFENNEWNESIIEYPDAIIDTLQIRGNEDAEWVYEELESIPIINEFDANSVSRKAVFDELQLQSDLVSIIDSSKIIQKTRDISKALEQHESILIQRLDWLDNQWITIEKNQGNSYTLDYKGTARQYNGIQLLNKLKEELTKNTFIVKEDPRAKVGKDKYVIGMELIHTVNGWSVISQYAQVGIESNKKFKSFAHILPESEAENICKEVKLRGKEIGNILVATFGQSFSFLTLSFAVTEKGLVKLLDVNPKPVNTVCNVERLAEILVDKGELRIREAQVTTNNMLI